MRHTSFLQSIQKEYFVTLQLVKNSWVTSVYSRNHFLPENFKRHSVPYKQVSLTTLEKDYNNPRDVLKH